MSPAGPSHCSSAAAAGASLRHLIGTLPPISSKPIDVTTTAERVRGVHRAFLNDGAACIPCNYVASPLIHWIYGAIARHELDEPAVVSRMIEKSSEYPERFDTNPFEAHWVRRADFIGWGLGEQSDFDSGWYFAEATSHPSI